MDKKLHEIVKNLFGKNGTLSKNLDGYEYRRSQQEMAIHVAKAIENEQHLVVEAGTGTGKTLAYLVPAIVSQRKIIVSTGTKNLQEQIVNKDIPLLQEIFPGKKFEFLMMKGRGNYLCYRKFKLFIKQPVQEDFWEKENEGIYLPEIKEWVAKTSSGDKSELEFLADNSVLWKKINSETEFCIKSRCYQDNCFIDKIRKKAHQSDIIIVNHHLYFSDIMVKGMERGNILPDTGIVIFDEAHLLENIATRFFGYQLSSMQFEIMVKQVTNLLDTYKKKSEEFQVILRRLLLRASQFFQLINPNTGQDRARLKRGDVTGETRAKGCELDKDLAVLSLYLTDLIDLDDEVLILIDRVMQTRKVLDMIISMKDQNYVYWCETYNTNIILNVSPVEIREEFQERVLKNKETVVLTSATLAAMNDFSFVKNRLGLMEPVEAILPTPFNVEKQVVLYIPRNLCQPRDENYLEQASNIALELLELMKGKTLLLFTSFKVMHNMYSQLKKHLPHKVLIQGEKSKSTLLKEFQHDTDSILFATSSFWQGVDVPGEALSCVIVDKLPFAVPTDPIMEARMERIMEKGGNPFMEYQLPNAIITLKQGFGRLIRSKSDKGILALLDSRVLTKHYGKYFLECFTGIPIAHDIATLKKNLPKGLIKN